MKIPQSFIEDLKSRFRLSEVIGARIPVRRAGREYMALCPFHKEKSPSFTINDEKGFYHCFGCGVHGDVIGFIKEYESVGYVEAIQQLAGQVGMAMPQLTKEHQAVEDRLHGLQRVMEAVCGWFEAQLVQTSDAEIARKYLRERGIRPETIAQFRLGFAPADRDALMHAMRQQGITPAQLIEVGALIDVEGRSPYSRFRRRLMFPIRDRKSRVVGFGGRVLPGEPQADAPKYLNSPETPLFHKGKQLYNDDRARAAGLKHGALVICEGYMDVIALAQAGITHAVAPLGTAITPEQLQLAWQMAPEPVLCLDGDAAGQRAMTRALNLALPMLVPGKTIRVARMPSGEDPDSLIKHQGVQAFHDCMAQAASLFDVIFSAAMARPATTPEARAAQEAGLQTQINTIADKSVQHYYRQALREKLRASQAFVPGKFNKKPADVVMHIAVPRPKVPADLEQMLSVPITRVLALVAACPELLEDGSYEDAWMHAPLSIAWHVEAHRAMSNALLGGPMLKAEDMQAVLRDVLDARALGELAKAAVEIGVVGHGDDIGVKLVADRLWPELFGDIHRMQLRAECTQAEAALSADMTEENFQRLAMLRQQLEAAERERTSFYRDDPLPRAQV
jgi:DNA primase catalytic core